MSEKFTSKFLLRLNEKLYEQLKRRALQGRTSINALCNQFIHEGLHEGKTPPWWQSDVEKMVDSVRKYFGRRVVGMLLFGSQIQGTATEDSDLDVLIVLDSSVPIRRGLYRWWDGAVLPHIDERINPQFVHIPDEPEKAGSIWFEVALTSHILWERGRAITSMLQRLRKLVDEDHIRRYFTHGQPYWVRRENEERRSRS